VAALGEQLRAASTAQLAREHHVAVQAAIREEVDSMLADVQRLQERGFALAAVSLDYIERPVNMVLVCDLLDSLREEFAKPLTRR
jgi:DNA repair ATPase RecN